MTTTTSRRAILAGVAAVPVLSLPAIAIETNPDAELIALGRELEDAWAALMAHQNGPQKEISDRYHELVPREPIGLSFDKMPRKLAKQIPWFGAPGTKREYLDAGEYAILKKFAPKHPVVLWQDKRSKKIDAESRERDQERERRARIAEECGLKESEAEWNRLYEECWDIFDEILETPARTAAGMAVKLRSLKYVAMEDDMAEEGPAGDFWQSLRTDILQMTV